MTACLFFGQGGGGGGGGVNLGPGEDTKSPDQIIADAKKDIQGYKTVHVTYSLAGKSGTITVELDMAENGDAVGSGTFGGANFDVVFVGGKSYIKGKQFFLNLYTGSAGSAAQQLRPKIEQRIDDHWVSDLHVVSTEALGRLKLDVFADCLDQHGTLAKGSTSDINGKKVIEVINKGDTAGQVEESIFVAVDSPHVVVRDKFSGKSTPGKAADAGKCKGTEVPPPSPGADPVTLTLELKDYGKNVSVQAPPGSDVVSLNTVFAP
jgi:hypothetical protein